MKFSYQFSNLLGTVYRSGDIIFTNDGNTAICPVGNKISMYNMKTNRSSTLPIEAKYNFNCLALSPNGFLLLASSEDGYVYIINLNYRRVLYKKHFNRSVKCIKFSPDGNHFAVAKENIVFVYSTPGSNSKVYDPFVMERVYHGAYSDVTCIDWTFDSRILAIGAEDGSTKVCAFTKFENFTDYSVGGSTGKVVGAFFHKDTYDLNTVSSNGIMNTWTCSTKPEDMVEKRDIYRKTTEDSSDSNTPLEDDDLPLTVEENQKEMETIVGKSAGKKEEKEKSRFYYRRKTRVFLDHHLKVASHLVDVTAVSYQKKLQLMVVACSTGDFLLFELTDSPALVHSLNISDQRITSVIFNPTGDWLALGVSTLGQLLVWEWQSETYVLKQQGHFNNMRVTAYSPSGQDLVTGGEDGKVKVWSTQSSFCYVTFSEHSAEVTGIAFTQSGRAIISSSLDGTVRAYDMIRYRNFKTLTATRPTQFTCVTVDTSGDLIAAGGRDCHSIYLWSLQTGKLLEILGGHEGPVTSLQFSPEPGSTMMVSTAWDSSVKVWNAIANSSAKETINICSDGLYVTFRPDGKQIAVATMDGQITTFDPDTGKQQNNISGRADLGSGRADADKVTAKKNLISKAFNTLCYSADGLYILAGGQSKHVCIYFLEEELLVKKFEVTQNRSFDAMDEIIDRKKMAEGGVNLALIEQREDGSANTIKLPGTQSGDKSRRAFRPEVRVTHLTFSPTGRSWASCSSEGLLIYSLDNDWLFDPLQLDMENTPTAVKHKLKQQQYSTALMMAVRLNVKSVKQEVLENIPPESIDIIVSNLSLMYVESVLVLLSELLEQERHIGLYTKWIKSLLVHHGPQLKSRSKDVISMINSLQKALTTHYDNLNKICSHNKYTLEYLLVQSSLKKRRTALGEVDDEEKDMSTDEGLAMSEDSSDENEDF